MTTESAAGRPAPTVDAVPASVLLALALLTLMWGVNWPVMKLGLREMTPLMFRAVTMSGGFVLLFIWYRLRGARLMLAQGELWRVAMLAAPNIVGWHALSIFGVEALASGRAAIVGFTMPIWTVLLSVVLFGERMQPRIWFATACAALAVVLLLWQRALVVACWCSRKNRDGSRHCFRGLSVRQGSLPTGSLDLAFLPFLRQPSRFVWPFPAVDE